MCRLFGGDGDEPGRALHRNRCYRCRLKSFGQAGAVLAGAWRCEASGGIFPESVEGLWVQFRDVSEPAVDQVSARGGRICAGH